MMLLIEFVSLRKLVAMGKSKNKQRINVVYSTNPDYSFESDETQEKDTLHPNQQVLYISHDRKMRKGKTVTLIEGFVGASDDLSDLGKKLKMSSRIRTFARRRID
jgi:translation initiation factor 1